MLKQFGGEIKEESGSNTVITSASQINKLHASSKGHTATNNDIGNTPLNNETLELIGVIAFPHQYFVEAAPASGRKNSFGGNLISVETLNVFGYG